MKELNATIKGIITGAALIIFFIIGYYTKEKSIQQNLAYVAPVIYGLGVVWTIYTFYKKVNGMASFGQLFNQGFKCFIVITLLLTLYYIIFYKLHPEIILQNAEETHNYLLENEKNRTPQEIEQMVKSSKSNFIIVMTSFTLFQNILIGAVVSAATAGALSLLKKK